MDYILPEADVSLPNLAEQLETFGWDVEVEDNRLRLYTEKGYAFTVWIDEDRKFLSFNTYLPVRKDLEDGNELVNKLNVEVFLPCFSIDADNDLRMTYSMMYARGLVLAQFSRIIKRFSSVIDYVCKQYGEDGGFLPPRDVVKETPEPELVSLQ